MHVLRTGPLGVNTYVVLLDGPRVLVVDPAACMASGDGQAIIAFLRERSIEPVGVVLTHGHFDHVCGLPALVSAFPGLPVLIHADDAALIGAGSAAAQGRELACVGFEDFLPAVSALPEPSALLSDGMRLGTAPCFASVDAALRDALCDWTVLHTPGHTPGSCCLYRAATEDAPGDLLSGDTLFYRSWGRTDLPGGSDAQMRRSLERLASLPPQTLVYPGHDLHSFPLEIALN